MHASRSRLYICLVLALLLLNACNFPRAGAPTPPGPELIFTYAAQTVESQLTQAASGIQPTFIPVTPGETATLPSEDSTTPPEATATLAPSLTQPAPSATPTEGICDRAAFVEDLTYPDDTVVEPGTEFAKTWRLKNTGTCSWNANYSVVFDHGEAMGATASKPLTSGTVAPGETIDVSIAFNAPDSSGTYQGFWRLRNAAGVLFGLGEKADKEFWVKIRVGIVSGIAYDFIARASSATWVSSGGGSEVTLNFGGADDDPNGVAKLKENITLEDGGQAGKTLITGPKHNDDGKITGAFPEYTVQEGDHFKAKLGFLENCEGARVIFQVWVQESGGNTRIGEWDKSCDSRLHFVEVDLAGLKGKKVKFLFVVLADGFFSGDLAIWGSPRVER